jgi:hypothetical protein
MSVSSYQKNPLPSPPVLVYELLSLKVGTTAIGNVTDGTSAPLIIEPIRNAGDTATLSMFLPIGLYAVRMSSAITGTANTQAIPICQQLLVDATDATVLASGKSIGTTTFTNTTYGDTILLSDSAFVNITVGRYVTLKLVVSSITNGATVLAPGLFGPATAQTTVTPRITAYRMV